MARHPTSMPRPIGAGASVVSGEHTGARMHRAVRVVSGTPGLWEVLVVAVLCTAMVLAVFVTYTRLPPSELYRVGHEGLAGGASRTLVLLNFPMALIALAVLGIVSARLLAHPWSEPVRRRRAVIGVALAAAALCAVTAWPGVVTEDAFDARPVNALPAAGVVLVIGLAIWTARLCGPGALAPVGQRDLLPLVLCGLFTTASIPWIAADLGYYASDIPLLDRMFVAEQYLPSGADHPAVHFGHHHGADGALFAVSGLVLLRTLWQMPAMWLRGLVSFALVLMVVYGVAILLNDLWNEQVVKRGWSTRQVLDSVLWPALTLDWALVLAVSAALWLVLRQVLHARDRAMTALLPEGGVDGSS